MQRDPRFEHLRSTLRGQAFPTPTLWQKILAAIIAIGVFALALMFSLVLLAAVVSVGVVAWGYLWWKTRAVRRQMRDNPPGGVVIEGEVIREVDERDPRDQQN